MQVNVEKLSPVLVEFLVKVPADEVKQIRRSCVQRSRAQRQ